MSSVSKAGLRRSFGFTLIELLIVIVIFASLLTLVAPLGVKTVKSAQAQSERVKLTSMLGELSYRAYLTNTSIDINFRGDRMQLVLPAGEQLDIEFNHLHFPAQMISFDRNGLSQSPQLSVHVNNVVSIISLDHLTTQRVIGHDE